MLLSAYFLIFCFICPTLVRCAFSPAALPLAVRSPYFQSYADTRAGNIANNQWPQYWNEDKILGWCGLVRIDNSTFQLWGDDAGGSHTNANLTSSEVTLTRTIFSIHANTTNVNVTFLSPIEPSDLVLQSLPFSYVYIDVESSDGQEHSIQLYSDITAEWISGDSSSFAMWNTIETESSTIHNAARQSPPPMQENDDLSEDATVYYAFPRSNDATYQTGDSVGVRREFGSKGTLLNTNDTIFRKINDKWVVLGHAVNLNNITSTASSVAWAIGLVRDPVISLGASNNRNSYFWTAYNTVSDAIDFFLSDFSNAKQRAIDLDNKIVSDARQISDSYADLVTLAARQALAVDITVSKDSQGQWNTSDIMTFMRDVGNSGRVNPVEILYASFPAYLYFNTTWAGYLLEPLLRHQQSSQYTKNYAAPDLGSSYPSAVGNNSPSSSRAIEDSGSMLIMGWAHARFSGDGSMISRYYDLYKKWADYLVSSTLSPNGYTDADGLANRNMTNLAIKGIIGIKAMSEISQALGRNQDAETYSQSKAKLYVEQWQIAAGSPEHLLSTYGAAADSSSWSLVYNLFADKLLGTELVDSSIYSKQDAFYSHEADNSGPYGIQYDSSVINETKSHWTMFTAGASNNTTVHDTLISFVHTKANSSNPTGVFPLTYDPHNGTLINGQASPGQGAMFSLLALRLPNKIVSDEDGSNNRDDGSSFSSPSNTRAIAGGVVGGLAALILLVFGVSMCRRRQRRKQEDTNNKPSTRRRHPLIPEPYNPYGSSGPEHPLLPLHPGQQFASVESLPRAAHRRRKGQSGLDSGPTTAASTLSLELSSVARNGIAPSDSNPSVQLRSELENLRREVDEIRARGLYEPPPEYR
ncbi:hypothetical protein IW261DRAFT_1681573 [Armillaria novae-zelandiae]|uniref:Glutaminase A n=1 Tax=Armillaria novae-zelandiae TaxID=153914 RepID=A0AA39UCH0_9AGAR|nr:hypothetical protein IW261DRAFT_1681573 [Armillaria novae-zelandiae]